MLNRIQRSSPLLSLVLLIALYVLMRHDPVLGQVVSPVVLGFGLALALIPTIQRHWEGYRKGAVTGWGACRHTMVDLLSLVLMIGAALWLGGAAGGYAGQSWGAAAGLLTAVLVGFASAALVGRVLKGVKA